MSENLMSGIPVSVILRDERKVTVLQCWRCIDCPICGMCVRHCTGHPGNRFPAADEQVNPNLFAADNRDRCNQLFSRLSKDEGRKRQKRGESREWGEYEPEGRADIGVARSYA